MKRFIIILLVLILVGGGGAGGLIMLGIIPNPFAPEGRAFFSQADRPTSDINERYEPHSRPLHLVEVSDMDMPVIMNGELVLRVSISIRLIAASSADRQIVKDNLPRYQDILMHAFIPYFQTHFYNHDFIDIRGIKSLLMEQSRKIYGDLVTDVLLINVFQREVGL